MPSALGWHFRQASRFWHFYRPYWSYMSYQFGLRPTTLDPTLRDRRRPWEALNDSEITFGDFLELLDLARSGADSL